MPAKFNWNQFAKTLYPLALLLAFSSIVGWLIGYPALIPLIILIIYTIWQLLNFQRLTLWLDSKNLNNPPTTHGKWEHIFYTIYKINKKQKKNKKQLILQLSRFQKAVAAIPDGAIVLNNDGTIAWLNQPACDFFGLNRYNDLHRRIVNLIRQPEFLDWFNDTQHDIPLEIQSPQDKQLKLKLELIHYGKNQRIITIRNITERQRIEQMRRDFVANVSHELRTPLTVVNGYLEMLAEEDQTDNSIVNSMLQQTQRMQRIVDDLLILARLEQTDKKSKMELINLKNLAERLKTEATLLNNKSQEITFDIDESMQLIGNETDIYTAFSNIICNAINYTQENGLIKISWEFSEENQEGYFIVADNGVGIASNHLSRLTERFYRAAPDRSRNTGGTGLGLAIVKHVLTDHQAQLTIQSEVGTGSIFTCAFPISQIQHVNP